MIPTPLILAAIALRNALDAFIQQADKPLTKKQQEELEMRESSYKKSRA